MSTGYRVVYPETVRAALHGLAARAAASNLTQSVRDALLEIDRRLRTDPRNFGEAKYRYRTLKLELRVGVAPPLTVHFTVHDEQPLVIVKAIWPLPRRGL